MALDDRERNFEKALRRELRANALQGAECPDAEALGAYHERLLSAEEMAAQKSHIVGCARCQEILATLEVTEPVSSEVEEKILARSAEKALAAVHAAPMFKNPSEMVGARAKRSEVSEIRKPKPYLRWIVPAGAIAAGLLVWVTVSEMRSPQKTATYAPVQVADNREQKTPQLSAEEPADKLRTGAPREKRAEKGYEEFTAPKAAANERQKAQQELDGFVKKGNRERRLGRQGSGSGTGSGMYSRGPSLSQNQVQNSINNSINAGNADSSVNAFRHEANQNVVPSMVPPRANAPKPGEQSTKVAAAAAPPAPVPTSTANAAAGDADSRKDEIPHAVSQTVEVQAAATTVDGEKAGGAQPSREVAAYSDKKASLEGQKSELGKEAAPNSAKNKKKSDDAGRTAELKQLQVSGAAAEALTSASLRDRALATLSIVGTPDAKIVWIITKDGVVLRSEDGLKTTRKQDIGGGTKAIAGSAPDAKVCWLLAENGIVLRTVNGGKHWTRTAAPTGKFSGISATDATNAIVSDDDAKTRYSTSDGGATWAVLSKP